MTMTGTYEQKRVPEKIRESVINRAGRRCYRCAEYDERPRRMVIHHLDYNETNNQPGNLLYLCHPCHKEIHRASFRPMGWNKHFYQKQQRLKEGAWEA